MSSSDIINALVNCRHPYYKACAEDWEKWRLTYHGGVTFRNRYLERFPGRESAGDFRKRRKLTPVPAFAKAAVNDIRNAVFQRMRDITRIGGSRTYREAVEGTNYGVDRRGSTMNAFLGQKVLSELLTMGRVGVFVDNDVVAGGTLADAVDARPYLYTYPVEDILSWKTAGPDNPSEFQSVLLRDTTLTYDSTTGLPVGEEERYRLLWLEDGHVRVKFMTSNGTDIGDTINLELTRIPFTIVDIGDSLLIDVCEYQIALVNLVSRDVWYALESNFTFYVEQVEPYAVGSHLNMGVGADSTATEGGQGAADPVAMAGTTYGRTYKKGMDKPGFISPSSEPLIASIQLQDKMEADIRKLVNLAVQTMATRASAESKQLDNQGLEDGLAFIGLTLENAERQIASFWADYENTQPATIKYPNRYTLKSDAERIKEAADLADLMYRVPSRDAKKEIAKRIVSVLLGGTTSVGRIEELHAEIDTNEYLTSDPDIILQAIEQGVCSEKVGSEALGFGAEVYIEARKDHGERLKRIAESQSVGQAPGTPAAPGARGLDDLSADPAKDRKQEKAASRDTTQSGDKTQKTRGPGRRIGAK